MIPEKWLCAWLRWEPPDPVSDTLLWMLDSTGDWRPGQLSAAHHQLLSPPPGDMSPAGEGAEWGTWGTSTGWRRRCLIQLQTGQNKSSAAETCWTLLDSSSLPEDTDQWSLWDHPHPELVHEHQSLDLQMFWISAGSEVSCCNQSVNSFPKVEFYKNSLFGPNLQWCPREHWW